MNCTVPDAEMFPVLLSLLSHHCFPNWTFDTFNIYESKEETELFV